MSKTINALTEDTSPASGDFLPSWDTSASATKKISLLNAQGGAWATWSPSYSGMSVGNGTVVSKYHQVGKTVMFHFEFTLGSTSTFTGPTISLPVTSAAYIVHSFIGNCQIYDLSATSTYGGPVSWLSTTTMEGGLWFTGGSYGSNVGFSGLGTNTPFTWATGDRLVLHGMYEAA